LKCNIFVFEVFSDLTNILLKPISMAALNFTFWVSFLIVFYSFLGYGIILFVLVKLKKKLYRKTQFEGELYEPEVTLVVPCYNEENIIPGKVKNSLQLDYPKEKFSIIFITDGSTDNSVNVLSAYPEVKNLHINRRAGKTAAENRAIRFVRTPIVIFSDANTILNKEAVKNIVRHFKDEKTGCVAGEKRVMVEAADIASSAGEGLYWKYESFLKKLDSSLYSAVGAAGELVAFRTVHFEHMPEDVILDDFMQSMQIAAKGYKIVYEPEAYAMETASASVAEELKRKIRIAAGGWQSIARLSGVLTFFKTPVLYFQYISHRVLRWTINPFLLILMYFISAFMVFEGSIFYTVLFTLQILFYSAALMGYFFETKKLKIKMFFVPYYFFIMNYAVVAGFLRFLKGSQKATWEKAARKTPQFAS
jgi:biofilm PGA synthesis N-glycosyltransferase PgaC